MREVPYVVEGKLDRSVIHTLFDECGLIVSKRRASQWDGGGSAVLKAVDQHLATNPNKALVAIRDLDGSKTGFPCAGEARKEWLKSSPPSLCFRIAVQEIEAWLLADKQAIISFFDVTESSYDQVIGSDPDSLHDPKMSLCLLAAQSRSRSIKHDVRLRPDGKEGSTYTSTIIKFVKRSWNPKRAANNSVSLRRCLQRLKEFAESGRAD